MARVKCQLCEKFVNTTANNYVFANGIHQHRKCPTNPKLSEEEKRARKDLTDAIEWLAVKYGKPLNWGLITSQIKKLLEKGYSHEDQLFSLKWLVERDGEFWGYGRLEKFITHAMEHKKKLEEFEIKKQAKSIQKKEEAGLKAESKPTFLEMGGDEELNFL